MPVTPLGNTIFINQNMNVAANKQADMQNRFDLQSLASMSLKQEKSAEIAEVRPAEETYKIDPKHSQERSRQGEKENLQNEQDTQKTQEEEGDEASYNEVRILDIKI